MDLITSFAKSVLKPRFQEDSVDRLNYQYTVRILSVFAVFISAREFFGEPIQCWVPAEYSGAWEQYVESYCFVESTYYVAMHKDLHTEHNTPSGPPVVSYYQWVPIVLFLQALMFYLPHMLWRLLNWQTGINVRGIISMACDKNIAADETKKNVCIVAGHMRKAMQLENEIHKTAGWTFSCGRYSGYYVNSLYIFIKLLWVVNIVAQFLILKDFLGVTSDFWGAKIFVDLLAGRTWNTTGNFPRVTFCDYKIRTLANLHENTVQCVLTINLFTEKIYVFVWWWFLLVAVITVASFFYWLIVSIFKSQQRTFIEKLLLLKNPHLLDSKVRQDAVRDFVRHMRPDGVFIVRMMYKNAGDISTSLILSKLFEEYQQDKKTTALSSGDTMPKPNNRRDSDISAPLKLRTSYGNDLDKAHLYPTAPAPIDNV